LSVSFNGDLADLGRFENVTQAAIGAALAEVDRFLAALAGKSVLKEKIPVLNKSLGELLGLTGSWTKVLGEFAKDPAKSLRELEEQLESALERALGFDETLGTDGARVEVSFDRSVAGQPALKIELLLETDYQGRHTVDLELPGFGRLLDAGAKGVFEVQAGAVLAVDLGIDLRNPAAPRPFLYDTTQANLTASINASDLAFSAAVGPLGLFVGSAAQPGVVLLDIDGGGPQTAPAGIRLGLNDADGDGRHYLTDPIVGDVTASINGLFHADLPVFFPTETMPLDPAQPSLVIQADLTDIAGTTSLTVPDLGNAIENLSDFASNLSVLSDGWSGFFLLLEQVLDGQVFGAKLPLIGDQLKDAARFIGDLRRKVVDNLEMAGGKSVAFVQQRLFEALGPGGLNWLVDVTPGNGAGSPTRHDVQVWVDGVHVPDPVAAPPSLDTAEVEFRVQLQQTARVVDVPIGFDIGLAGLGLEVNGAVQLEVGFDWDLRFGVSKSAGVYLGTGAADELTVQVAATLPGLRATGRLGFLQLDVVDLVTTDKDGDGRPDGSWLGGQFRIDLVDPNHDHKLTLAELSGASFGQVVSAGFSGRADVDLDFVVGFGNANFPSFKTQFSLDWDLFNADTSDAAGEFGGVFNVPEVSFTNFRINPGQVIQRFAGPVLDTINGIIEPLRPVLDVITAPLPLISDLAGSPVTLLDVAEFFGYLSPATRDFIEAAAVIVDLAEAAGSTGGGDIVLSGFSIDNIDLRSQSLAEETIPDTGAAPIDGPAGEFLDKAKNLASGNGEGLRFPVLEKPSTLFNLVLGRDIPLVTYDMPELMVDARYHQAFPIFPPFLTVILDGRIGVRADFAFGFDTSGLRQAYESGNPADVFNGFYVSDTENADGTGRDVPELELFGSFTAAAVAGIELDIGVARISAYAGAEGGLFATIGFNLYDPNHDGKVHINELGKSCLFETEGSLDAALTAVIKIEVEIDLGLFDITITIINERFELFSITLLDFSTSCRPGPAPDINPPPLAHMQGSTLVLNTSDRDDNFQVLPGAQANEIWVQSGARRQRFNNVAAIRGLGGLGNDVLAVDRAVTLPVHLEGGPGNDRLTAGGGPAVLIGDAGDDVLTGGPAADVLRGGPGNDRLFGGAGNDLLDGGAGDDLLDGGLDDDVLWGGPGADVLRGGDGRDVLHGGGGADRLEGGPGNDVLYGDEGDDYLDGGLGNDTIYGGAGSDTIYGGGGTDQLYGDGGPGYEVDATLAGDDVIIAGTSTSGGDLDSIHEIHGGPGNDRIYGDSGRDTIYAGPGNDVIYALAGNDWVDGGSGDDVIYGGGGSDYLIGGWGRDTIYAGHDRAGSPGGADDVNTTYGDVEGPDRDDPAQMPGVPSDHRDRIYGDHGDDTIYAGFGDDVVVALEGSDTIEGGWGADTIHAGVHELGGGSADDRNVIYGDVRVEAPWPGREEDHRDRVYGDIGPDRIYVGLGSDVVFALGGNDWIDGGPGDDYLDAGSGDDIVYAGAGHDTVLAGAGNDLVYGGSGNDGIRGDAGDDFLVGGTGDDEIAGGDGSDVIWGGTEVISFESFRRGVTTDFAYPTNFPGAAWNDLRGMPRIVPVVLAGLSVDGQIDDGKDRLRGDDGNDWLFGGGDADDLDGGVGIDYVDGGAGNDSVRGGAGDDVVRGGAGDDVLRGGAGIDQLFGDGGVDYLFADAGVDADGQHVLQFQRLFGGDGIDYLYAYAQSTLLADVEVEKNLIGDELHGGAGGRLAVRKHPPRNPLRRHGQRYHPRGRRDRP